MNGWLALALLFAPSFAFSANAPAESVSQAICPDFILRGREKISLSDSETRLICGDPKNDAWSNIPDSQAMFHLKTFLQDRGYYSPKLNREPKRAVVDLGPQTHVSGFQFQGDSTNLDPLIFRHVTGELLTPGFLDQLTKRVHAQLRGDGYPCPKVICEADPTTGKVVVRITNGPKQNVISVNEEAVAGINEKMLRRYDAFALGEPFNESLLNLTSDRTTSDGILQSTHFTAECANQGAVLSQTIVPGPPRNFIIGLGVDTEELAKLKVTWKNQRMGNTGSSLEVAGSISYRLQQIGAVGKWYYLNTPSRHYLRPSLVVGREYIFRDDPPKERYFGQAQLAPAITWDNQSLGLQAYAGPTFIWESKTKPNPVQTYSLSLSGDLVLQTHDYELNRSHPRGGATATLHADFANREWLSNISVRTLRVTFAKLWNVKNYDPPWNVFGIRGGVATTFTDEVGMLNIPEGYRNYLGGSQDLRGFGVREIAGTNVKNALGSDLGPQGGLTSAFLDLEDRFPDILPFGLQPFVFLDAGMFGRDSLSLDALVYWNPGLGLRWDTQIGVFRFTVAHGYLAGNTTSLDPGRADTLSHWNLYLSYGQEF